MKVLVTGFSPFGGESINPSFEALKLAKDRINGVEVIKREIPTVFNRSLELIESLIEEIKPDIVICFGQSGGESKIRLEKVAINLDEARIADNEGNKPTDRKIKEDGDTAYFSNLPIKNALKNLNKKNIPSRISYSAGTFVCNHIFYGLMYLIDKKYEGLKGGFVHLPYLPEQVLNKSNTPFMTMTMMSDAINIIVKTFIEEEEEIKNIDIGTIC